MELFLWDSYGEEDINDKIKYWVDIWGELIANFNINSYGLNLINPHTLVNDIIDEIVSNKMRNKENKNYLLKQINSFLANDEIIKRNYKIEFEMIRDYLNSDKNEYLLNVCRNIKDIFINGDYLKETYHLLKSILLSTEIRDDCYKKIVHLCQSMIVELLLKGFDIQTVKKMPINIFKEYNTYGEYIATNYPHNVNRSDFEDKKDYYKAIKGKINNLSIEDRLNDFESYFDKQPSNQLIIFPIEGLIAYNGFSIGDVHFYSPRVKKFISQPEESDDEIFLREEEHIFNASVWVNAVDDETARQIAIDKIEKSFDVLRCFYKTKVNFSVIKNKCITLNEEYQLISERHSTNVDDVLKDQYSLNMEEVNIEGANELIFENTSNYLFENRENQSFTEQKIVYSLHWFRKGAESIKAEDQLLNYWIVIENLMDFKESNEDDKHLLLNKEKETTYSLAKELVPCVEIPAYKRNISRDLFRYIKNLMGNKSISIHTGESRRGFEIPIELQEKCNLESHRSGRIDLKPFIRNLKELNEYTERKVIQDKVAFCDKFYTDSTFTLEAIEERIKQIQDDILYIYRYRNKIVHNAHYDTLLLPHYVSKVKEYANNLLVQVLYEYSKNNNLTLKEIFLKWHLSKSIFMKKLKENKSIDILEYRFL